MPITRRRRIALLVTVLAALVIGAGAAVTALAADTERIGDYWVSAELTDSGLQVSEVIDYDFGVLSRHGIYRTIPDVVEGSIRVESPTAPDHADIGTGYGITTVKIGEAATTITGRHRYRIDYTLALDAVVQNGVFSYNAVGKEWTVPIENFRLVLVLPVQFLSARCAVGTAWDESACQIDDAAVGSGGTVERDHLDAGEALTVSGRLGEPDTAAVDLKPPTGPASDPGSGFIEPFLIAVLAALAVSVPATVMVRRAGRERVWSGGAADAAWGEVDDDMPSARIDERSLAELATIEFEPPRDMSAVEGALLLEERVRDQHLSAWLLESAIRDEISISGEEDPVLHRGAAPPHPGVHPILDSMFGGREKVKLGSYDKRFTEGWARLERELGDWLHGSAHWDREGSRRRTAVRVIGAVSLLGGLAAMVFAVVGASRDGGGSVLIIGGAAVAGVGAAIIVHSFELLVRTEMGSAYWLRVESFRRFLHESEARHVNEAAEKGVLRHYTAWAVALGEADNWFKAVDTAARNDPALRSTFGRDIAFVSLGSHIATASRAASTAPKSSGGGGFSGGAGGGGGGGGGGSW